MINCNLWCDIIVHTLCFVMSCCNTIKTSYDDCLYQGIWHLVCA